MKKLLCFALISMAMLVRAGEKKEIVSNNSKEIEVENVNFAKEIKFEHSMIEIEAVDVLVDCGEKGDLKYMEAKESGYSHRDARSIRRAFVRDCRGGTWAWLGVCIGFIGHCDEPENRP